MEMKAVLLTAVLLMCQTALSVSQEIDPLKEPTQAKDQVDLLDHPAPKMKMIGVVGSHTYFYDQGRRNWENSRSFCQSLGMELAELTTQAHFQLLADYADQDSEFEINNYYWTAGRDSGRVTQFAWDSNGANIATDLPFGGLLYGAESCLFYGTGSRRLYGTPCSDSGDMVLCQT